MQPTTQHSGPDRFQAAAPWRSCLADLESYISLDDLLARADAQVAPLLVERDKSCALREQLRRAGESTREVDVQIFQIYYQLFRIAQLLEQRGALQRAGCLTPEGYLLSRSQQNMPCHEHVL